MTIIYVSCKQTKTVQDALEKVQDTCVIGISDPRYNKSTEFRAAIIEGETTKYFDVPVFTLQDNETVIKLMQHPTFVKAIQKLMLAQPVIQKDPFVLNKLLKAGEDVDQLITFLTEKGYTTHVENIEAFLSEMSKIPDDIKTPQQLIAWQKTFPCLKEGFENHLHWDEILGYFGPFPITTQQLLEHGFLNELPKVQGVVGWLVKGINLIKVDGSAADVLNLVKFMFSTTHKKEDTIHQLVDFLLENDFQLPQGATVPDELWIDGELDDDWALALTYLVRRQTNQNNITKLVVQWPGGNLTEKAKKMEMTVENLQILLNQNLIRYHKLDSARFVKDLYLFIDEDSDNCNKVIRKWKI
jgi:hypothetical protein